MLKIIFLKILRRLLNIITKIVKNLYLKNEVLAIFPLIKKTNKTIKDTKGFYWRLFQSEVKSINGMTSDEEAEKLFFLSMTQNIRGDIVEIGSWLGKSTVHLAKGCQISKNGIVHAVDTFQGNKGKESLYTNPLNTNETIVERFKKNIKTARVQKEIKIYKMTSKEASKKIRKKLRLVFIDGCHDYEFVAEDIQLWSKKLQKGGLIVLDDFTSYFPGVIKAIEDEIISNKNYKVLLNYDSFFIAQKLK